MVAPIVSRSYADMSKSQRDTLLGKITVPGTRTRLLTNASKMPAPTFSLPAGKGAGKACPWSTTEGPDTICGSCYAQKGNYGIPAVKDAASARFNWTLRCLQSAEGMRDWVATMVGAINATGTGYFRWHDSGDMFSPVYAHLVWRVIQETPNVHHWIPTRAWRAPWANVLDLIAQEPNATVRPSALRFDEMPPVIPALHAGSGATRTASNCPAPTQGNACQDCRRCWHDKTTVILYHKH